VELAIQLVGVQEEQVGDERQVEQAVLEGQAGQRSSEPLAAQQPAGQAGSWAVEARLILRELPDRPEQAIPAAEIARALLWTRDRVDAALEGMQTNPSLGRLTGDHGKVLYYRRAEMERDLTELARAISKDPRGRVAATAEHAGMLRPMARAGNADAQRLLKLAYHQEVVDRANAQAKLNRAKEPPPLAPPAPPGCDSRPNVSGIQ
jgi:hypothetical protein